MLWVGLDGGWGVVDTRVVVEDEGKGWELVDILGILAEEEKGDPHTTKSVI